VLAPAVDARSGLLASLPRFRRVILFELPAFNLLGIIWVMELSFPQLIQFSAEKVAHFFTARFDDQQSISSRLSVLKQEEVFLVQSRL
jgi:hypothetical protein